MATFPFPYFSVGDEYPESSTKVRFGRGYSFTSAPKGPDQIMFILSFEGMWFFVDEAGDVDETIEADRNMKALIDWYELYRCHAPFDFEHPLHGLVSVKFDKPLAWKLVKNGRGLVEPFEIRLELQP